MRKGIWSTVIALVVLFGMFATGVLGENITESVPSDQEIIEVMVFYKYGPEVEYKIYDEYSDEDYIYYQVFDSEGHGLAGGIVDRETMIDKYF